MHNATTQPVTNPGTPSARQGNRVTRSTTAVVGNQGANWATMVLVGHRAYQVMAIGYTPTGAVASYTVVTRAGLQATVPARLVPAGTYTGYTAQGQHYGACKLATAMGLVKGLGRYAQ